jgi:hypothetical protein
MLNLLLGILFQNWTSKGVDQVKAPTQRVPPQLLHDGGADEPGIDTTFDEVTMNAQCGSRRPQSDMHPPLKPRVNAGTR